MLCTGWFVQWSTFHFPILCCFKCHRSDKDSYLRTMTTDDLGIDPAELTSENFGIRAYRSIHKRVQRVWISFSIIDENVSLFWAGESSSQFWPYPNKCKDKKSFFSYRFASSRSSRGKFLNLCSHSTWNHTSITLMVKGRGIFDSGSSSRILNRTKKEASAGILLW